MEVNKDILKTFLSAGFRVIVVNLWEAQTHLPAKNVTPYLDNILVILGCKNSCMHGWKNVIDVPNYFWYNESLWYTFDENLQYQNYVPDRTNNKLFFMPIGRSKYFRSKIIERFDNLLDNAIWSHVEAGKYLYTKKNISPTDIRFDRYFEEDWYNDTFFTVSVETGVGTAYTEEESKGHQLFPAELFITEKTYKPIAHQHPFMVLGMKGILSHLRSIGFETFDNIFNESYDNLDIFEDRLEIVYNNIKTFNKEKYLDPLTYQKIEHNYNHFYNRQLIIYRLHQELINPMLEWINA